MDSLAVCRPLLRPAQRITDLEARVEQSHHDRLAPLLTIDGERPVNPLPALGLDARPAGVTGRNRIRPRSFVTVTSGAFSLLMGLLFGSDRIPDGRDQRGEGMLVHMEAERVG